MLLWFRLKFDRHAPCYPYEYPIALFGQHFLFFQDAILLHATFWFMCGRFILYILDITGIQWLWLLLCRYFGPTMIAEHRDSYAGLYFVERNGQNGVQTAGRKGIGWMLGLPIYQLWHLIVLFCSPRFCIWGGLVPRKPLMTLRSRTVPIPNFLLFCGYIKRRFFAYYCLLNYNHIKIQFFSKVSIIHHALPSRVGRLFADILHILTCIVETSTFILCFACFILSTLFLYYPRLSTFIYVFFHSAAVIVTYSSPTILI